MDIDYKKLARQLKGVELFFQHDCIGTLEYVFQFGKTHTAKLIIDKFIDTRNAKHITIIVPNLPLVDQWRIRLESYDSIRDILNRVEIEILTAHEVVMSNRKFNTDLLIVDEIHGFTSTERYEIIKGAIINYSRILGLTGSYPNGQEKAMLDKYCPVIDKISFGEAASNNWISGIYEYNLGLDLPPEDKIRYARFSEPIRDMIEQFRGTKTLFKEYGGGYVFKSDFAVIMACYSGRLIKTSLTQNQYLKGKVFRELVAKHKGWRQDLDLRNDVNRITDERWNPDNLEVNCRRFKSFVEKRNSLIIDNDVKLKTVLDIFDKFQLPTLCFNESIDFAEKIAYNINRFKAIPELGLKTAASFHSKIKSRAMIDEETGDYFRFKTGDKAGLPKPIGPDSIKKMILSDIENGNTMFISTVKTLKEGISIPNLRMIITTAGDANPITHTQKVGRGMTLDQNDDTKITKVVNIYFEDFDIEDKTIKSRDKRKLIDRQARSENLIQWIKNISEIE